MAKNEASLRGGSKARMHAHLAFALTLCFLLACNLWMPAAFADDDRSASSASGSTSSGATSSTSGSGADDSQSTQKTALELAQQVEDTQSAYAAAREAVDKANEEIAQTEQRIADVEGQIPAQQRRSSEAYRELYKFQQHSAGIVELLLGSESFHDFLTSLDYVSYVADANMAEIRRLDQMKEELTQMRDGLTQSRSEADAKADEAKVAMDAALEAQAEVQRRIEEEARMEAEIAAAAAALAEEPRSNDQGSAEDVGGAPAEPADGGGDAGGSGGSGDAGDAGGAGEAAPAPVDMSGDEAAFVSSWAPRIDAYLAGSPLAGQGATFARAAYEYGVDPRWSPAISCTESSKGRYCFNPHNAWGWGSASWDSWEEAIFDHVGGLSRGYGYTISEAAAQKYCPPNWQHWYNTTLAQMNMI